MIIGISGKMQSGKDTVADYLVNKYGFQRIAFAAKLKEIAKDLFGWDGKKDEYGRKLLQDLGFAMRSINRDVWINYALKNIDLNQNWVTTDVRYMNEAFVIQSKSGLLWRINRNIIRNEEVDNHISETDLDHYDKFDAIIENNGSFNELHDRIDKLLKGKSL
jgi:hypothetical protein